MARALSKRLLSGLLILFIFITVLFFFLQLIMVGDYVLVNFWYLTPDEREAIRAELGLNAPLINRYISWLWDLIRLDLGESYAGFAVGPAIAEALKRSFLLLLPGITIAFVIGSRLGEVTAWRGARFWGDLVIFVFILLYAFFPPSMVFMLQNLFRNDVGIVTISPQMVESTYSRGFPDIEIGVIYDHLLWTSLGAILLTVALGIVFNRLVKRRLPAIAVIAAGAAMWVVLWATGGRLQPSLVVARSLIIPIAAFILLSIGDILIVSRESVIDTVFSQYLTTARAKGLKDAVVRERHASRNAILPVMSKFIISLPYMLTGLTIIEATMNWPGIGSLLYAAVDDRDIPVTMACLLVLGVFSLVTHLGLETALVIADPRLRKPAEADAGEVTL